MLRIAGAMHVRRSNGEGSQGFVISVSPDGMARVQFAEGPRVIHVDDLSPVEATGDGNLYPGDSALHLVKMRAIYLQHAHEYDPLSTISSSRIDPMPHQVFVAHRTMSKAAPRMILADEVGLGKTIEAGLIIKELRARGIAERVLILTPASLTLQWQNELRNKFGESFEVFDSTATKHYSRGGQNAWASRSLVIASLPFAVMPKQAEAIVEADWDLVVVDEAHRLRRTKAGSMRTTAGYKLIDALKDRCHGLLLLTATPMQLQLFELYSLIELVEPGLYPTFASYQAQSDKLPSLNNVMHDLLKWPDMSIDERNEFVRMQQVRLAKLKLSLPDPEVDDIDQLLDEMSMRHPLSEVMVRNRKAELDIVSKRMARRIMIDMTPEETAAYVAVEEYLRFGHDLAKKEKHNAIGFLMSTYYRMLTSSSHALRLALIKRSQALTFKMKQIRDAESSVASPPLDLTDPLEADDLERLAADSLGTEAQMGLEIAMLDRLADQLKTIQDGKAKKLRQILEELEQAQPGIKIVIFTQFTRTLTYLQEYLTKLLGFDVAIFHGHMRPDEKEGQIARFRGPAQILISTEAGGEGRNLQFAHILINYDLPWNPMKVEQRIGRLDRIGQEHPVVIYNLAYRDTMEERVLDILEYRIELFENSVGSLDPILGDVETFIAGAVFEDAVTASQAMEKFGTDLERLVLSARAAERVLGDFMMDRSSLRRDYLNNLLKVGPMADHETLRHMMAASLYTLGGTLEEHVEGGDYITPSKELAASLGVKAQSIRGTFNPAIASEMDDLEFFAFGNEFIDAVIRLGKDLNCAGIGSRTCSDVPSGLWLEVVYRFKFTGYKPESQLVRYLASESGEILAIPDARIDLRGDPIHQPEIPAWVAQRAKDIDAQVEVDGGAYRLQKRSLFASYQEQAVVRAERVFAQRDLRSREDLARESKWVNENKDSESENIRRVLPARQGRVRHLEGQLEKIEGERAAEMKRIRSSELIVELEPLWTCLVRGAS